MISTIQFFKYHGTGNDFIMVDNRNNFFPKLDYKTIEYWCDRHFGIGADGLILIENDSELDFKMVYYNSDGKESTMCGNGGRCIVAFAKQLGIIEKSGRFNAVDGQHYATIDENNIVTLQMSDVSEIQEYDDYSFLNTGSPHHITMVSDLDNLDVYKEGKAIRESSLYAPEGTNVNFVKQYNNNTFEIRTYERGVENETLSCGTGATAVAIAMYNLGKTKSNQVNIKVKGGELSLSFKKEGDIYTSVFLTGPTELAFEGEKNIKHKK